MTTRTALITIGLVTSVALAVVALVVLPARAAEGAAHTAAKRYVDLIATGDQDDLRSLWTMSATETPGALRTAGQVLVAAEERIEVLDVGAPRSTGLSSAIDAELEEFVAVKVRYRLDGQEVTTPIVLGKLEGERGTDVGDWRVAVPLTGSIAWVRPEFAGVAPDAYVSSIRQVRRSLLFADDEQVQALYPAVYSIQTRLDPYFASEVTSLPVHAGAETGLPELPQMPTDRTKAEITEDIWREFDSCAGGGGPYRTCPVSDLVEDAGVESEGDDWWLGFTQKPTLDFEGQQVTLTDGAFRYRGRAGKVEEVRFSGTARHILDNQSWTPYLFEIDVVEEK